VKTIDLAGSEALDTRDSGKSEDAPTVRLYLNVYAVTRHYGGPEEGGWWFNAGEPLASVPFEGKQLDGCPTILQHGYCACHSENGVYLKSNPAFDPEGDEAEMANVPEHLHVSYDRAVVMAKRLELEKMFADVAEGNIYSMRGGVAVEVQIQSEVAAHWPRERPHYE
jgi:hypothetical protein